MKKSLLFVMIAMIGITVSAADQTKEQFLARSKTLAEKGGKTFDAAKAEETFAKKDLNKDGVLSAEEAAAGAPAKKGKKK